MTDIMYTKRPFSSLEVGNTYVDRRGEPVKIIMQDLSGQSARPFIGDGDPSRRYYISGRREARRETQYDLIDERVEMHPTWSITADDTSVMHEKRDPADMVDVLFEIPYRTLVVGTIIGLLFGLTAYKIMGLRR